MYKPDFDSINSVNSTLLMSLLAIWNLGIIGALVSGDGSVFGFYGETVYRISLGLLIATVLVLLAIAGSRRVRTLVLDPDRAQAFRPGDFIFMAAVAAIIGAGLI